MCDPAAPTLPEPDDTERVLLAMERLLLDPPEDKDEERRLWFCLGEFCRQQVGRGGNRDR